MKKKDLLFIKKIIGTETETSVLKVACCYVDVFKGEKHNIPSKTFLNLPEEEMSQYLLLFKKSVTGKIGSTTHEFTIKETQFDKLRSLKLGEEKEIESVSQLIIENTNMDENYCILYAYGAADIPSQKGAIYDSEEVYEFLLTSIIPCSLSAEELIYDYSKNSLNNRSKDRILGKPLISFLYPSMDGLHTEIDKCAVTAKNEKSFEKFECLIKALLDAVLKYNKNDQMDNFKELLKAGSKNGITFDMVQDIYEDLIDKRIDAEMSGEETIFSSEEIAGIVAEHTDTEKSQVLETVEEFKDCKFTLDNILPKKIEISTDSASIIVDAMDIKDIKRKMIDGEEYYLIPARHSTIMNIVLENTKK